MWASPVALMVKNWPEIQQTQDSGSVPGWGRSPGGGHGNPLWYSCLENPWTEEPGGLQYVGSQSRTWLMAHELSILIQCLCFCDWWCIVCQNVLPFLLLNSIPLYVTAACPDPFICYGRGLSPP